MELEMNLNKVTIVLLHAFANWVLCASTVGIGRSIISMENTLIIHLFAAPLFAAAISYVYFKKFNYTSPWATAIIFLAFTFVVDFFIIAPFVENSYEMFSDFMLIWIPWTLAFVSVYLTGRLVGNSSLALGPQ